MKKFLALASATLLVGSLAAATAAVPSGALVFDDFSNENRFAGDKIITNSGGLESYWTNDDKFDAGVDVTYTGSTAKIKYLKGSWYEDMGDWSYGNWGEAFPINNISEANHKKGVDESEVVYYKTLNITIKSSTPNAEDYLVLRLAPTDEDNYCIFFNDLKLTDGSSPKITDSFQTFKIDLLANKLPQATDRLHIMSAVKGVEIEIDDISFSDVDAAGKAPTILNKGLVALKPKADLEALEKQFADGGKTAEATPAPADNTASTDTGSASNPSTADYSFILYAGIILVLGGAALTVLKVRKNNV